MEGHFSHWSDVNTIFGTELDDSDESILIFMGFNDSSNGPLGRFSIIFSQNNNVANLQVLVWLTPLGILSEASKVLLLPSFPEVSD